MDLILDHDNNTFATSDKENSMSPKRILAVVGCFSLLSLLGWAPRLLANETADVSGEITLDGKPLAGGEVLFHQESGQFVGANIDKGSSSIESWLAGTRLPLNPKAFPTITHPQSTRRSPQK